MSSAERQIVHPCIPSITISYLWCITRSSIKQGYRLFPLVTISQCLLLSPLLCSLSLSQFNPYNERLSIKGSDSHKSSLSHWLLGSTTDSWCCPHQLPTLFLQQKVRYRTSNFLCQVFMSLCDQEVFQYTLYCLPYNQHIVI